MKERGHKVYWGIWLILCAVALLLYALGIETALFEISLYRLIFSSLLTALIISKLVFGYGIREKLSNIFLKLALLFCLLEEPIAVLTGLENTNFVNSFAIIAASILLDIGLKFVLPKKSSGKKDSNFSFTVSPNKAYFSNETRYIDATQTTYASIQNKMGNTDVYYQNTDLADPDIPLELNIINKMANITVHVPDDWEITNHIHTNMGNTTIRANTGSRIKLTLTGDNKMGNIDVTSDQD